MNEERPGSEIEGIKRQLEALSPDSRRELVSGLFWQEFGGDLSPSTQQEIQKSIESRGSKEHSAETSEDEWLKSVTDVSIRGKFPQGLDIKGKEFVAAKPYGDDYKYFSPTDWRPSHQQLFIIRRDLLNGNGRSRFSESSFITITPDPKNPDYLCLTYIFDQDRNVRDSSGRYSRLAEISMLMPKDKAREFVQHIKEQEDGADIAERFLQKAVPGSIASDNNSRGIRRIKTTELFVLDEEFQRDFFGEDFISNYEAYSHRRSYGDSAIQDEMFRRTRSFSSYAFNDVIRKTYSPPGVGFGEPEK